MVVVVVVVVVVVLVRAGVVASSPGVGAESSVGNSKIDQTP
jgi:hypothetical protein